MCAGVSTDSSHRSQGEWDSSTNPGVSLVSLLRSRTGPRQILLRSWEIKNHAIASSCPHCRLTGHLHSIEYLCKIVACGWLTIETQIELEYFQLVNQQVNDFVAEKKMKTN